MAVFGGYNKQGLLTPEAGALALASLSADGSRLRWRLVRDGASSSAAGMCTAIVRPGCSVLVLSVSPIVQLLYLTSQTPSTRLHLWLDVSPLQPPLEWGTAQWVCG